MRNDVLTLFPEMFAALDASIPGRARKSGAFELHCHALRDFAINKHGQVDDVPFGGEAGMVLRPEPLKKGLDHVSALLGGDGREGRKPHVLQMSAQGRIFTQDRAKELAEMENL